MLKNLLKIYWQIFMMRTGPQDLPYSKYLLAVLVFLSLFANYIANRIFAYVAYHTGKTELQLALLTPDVLLILGASSLLIMFAYVMIGLSYYKFSNRLIQMMLALVGMDILLTIFFTGVVIFLPFTLLALLFVFVLLYWQFMIHTHIFSHGYSIGLIKAGFFALIYLLIQHNISEYLLKILIEKA